MHEKIAAAAQTKYGLTYQPLDQTKIETLTAAEKDEVQKALEANNQATLAKVAVLPVIMCLCYVGLIVFFKCRGGYRQVQIQSA